MEIGIHSLLTTNFLQDFLPLYQDFEIQHLNFAVVEIDIISKAKVKKRMKKAARPFLMKGRDILKVNGIIHDQRDENF